MTHNEKIQTAIDSINDLEISRQDKDRLIQQIKAAVPNEEDFLSQCQSLIQGMNRYDASAMNRTSVRIGTAQGLPCVFVWYSHEDRATFVRLYFASWQKTLSALNDNFMKNLDRILSGKIPESDLGADRLVEESLDVYMVMRELSAHGEVLIPV